MDGKPCGAGSILWFCSEEPGSSPRDLSEHQHVVQLAAPPLNQTPEHCEARTTDAKVGCLHLPVSVGVGYLCSGFSSE